MDLEMGKSRKPLTSQAKLGKKSSQRRGHWRLPMTVGACFVLLFVFFVLMGGGSNGKRSGRGGRQLKTRDVASGGWGARADGRPRVYRHRVVRELPHDRQAFTQGLQFDRVCDGEGEGEDACREVFWESTGLNGQSTVREVEVESGRVLRSKKLPESDFGEGITRHGDRLYQVTWQSGRTWSYAVSDFEDAQQLTTPLADGWGITSDGQHLIVGDSSHTLTWLDPGSMEKVREVAVTDDGKEVRLLNELEVIDGLVWANVWMTNCIAQVDPASGSVVGWVLMGGLRQLALKSAAADAAAGGQADGKLPGREQPEVLNGIAFDEQQRRLFVGGKLWPRIYQVELEEVPAAEAAGALKAARQACIPQGDPLRGLL